jgi:hypothetical protein
VLKDFANELIVVQGSRCSSDCHFQWKWLIHPQKFNNSVIKLGVHVENFEAHESSAKQIKNSRSCFVGNFEETNKLNFEWGFWQNFHVLLQ